MTSPVERGFGSILVLTRIQGVEEMGLPERTVTALARAYSMSEVLPLDEATVRQEVESVTASDRDVTFRVVARGIAVDGELLDDSDGSLAEMSRDLGQAGVTEVRLSAWVASGSVGAFIRSLRDGSDELRRSLEGLPEISVSFRGGEPDTSDDPGATETAAPPGMDDDSGFARSVAALFREKEEGSPEAEGAVMAAGARREAAGDAEPSGFAADEVADDPEPPDLLPLVDEYLQSDEARRDALEDEIRRGAEEASEMEAHHRVAKAVERLVLEADSEGDGPGTPGALELARDLFGPDVAAAIVRRLGALRDDEERARRIRVATTLRGPMARAFSDGLADTDDRGARHAYLDALIALGEDGRSEARKMLDDSRWWVIRNGATILGGTGIGADVEDLTTHLAHDDARVRLQIVRALAHIGGEDAGMLLLGMVDDPDPDVRAAVATALGALEPDRAVKSLLERLETEDAQKVEVQILRALGALGDPGAVPSIEKRAASGFFSKSPVPVRVAAYRALASIGTPRATQLLEEARDDRNEEVRRTVRDILERRRE